jgi:ATP-dependent RNA helicase HelY
VQEASAVARFAHTVPFELDDFQIEANQALEDGRNVLVAAPTGAGKTVAADFAMFLAQERNVKAFYTTPIKALSNQKYHDLVAVYGSEKVGLLTGDTSINAQADIVVMTTEVLRNMLYEHSTTLDALRYVVLDEVHYLADRLRGPVWEEVIIHLPEAVRIVALSATVSNVEDFSSWIASVRGDTRADRIRAASGALGTARYDSGRPEDGAGS